jgi:hypothetical protein
MATIQYWQTSWVDAGDVGLQPGQQHYWIMWGFDYTDAVAVTPAPLNSFAGDQILQVTDVRSEADPEGGRRLFFTVQNTGPVRALGYGLNVSFISP